MIRGDARSPKLAWWHEVAYRSASPDRPVPLRVLKNVIASSREQESVKSAVVAANALLELATHPEISSERQTRFARQSGVMILTKVMNGPSARQKERSGQVRAHLPLFVHGPTERAKYITKQQLCERIDSALPTNPLAVPKSGYEGYLAEDVTDLTLGHTGIAGLWVLASTERQNIGSVTVDGYAYAWDRTAISDGSTLPRGEYRLQVKSTKNALLDHARYHPEIVTVCGDTHLGVDFREPEEVAEFYGYVKEAGDEGGNNLAVRRARAQLLEQLDATGPIESGRSILPAA